MFGRNHSDTWWHHPCQYSNNADYVTHVVRDVICSSPCKTPTHSYFFFLQPASITLRLTSFVSNYLKSLPRLLTNNWGGKLLEKYAEKQNKQHQGNVHQKVYIREILNIKEQYQTDLHFFLLLCISAEDGKKGLVGYQYFYFKKKTLRTKTENGFLPIHTTQLETNMAYLFQEIFGNRLHIFLANVRPF